MSIRMRPRETTTTTNKHDLRHGLTELKEDTSNAQLAPEDKKQTPTEANAHLDTERLTWFDPDTEAAAPPRGTTEE